MNRLNSVAMSTVALAAALCTAVPLSTTAAATPPSGVTAQTLGSVTVPLPGSPGVTVTLRRVEIAPAGTTGWHTHQGPIYAFVQSGTLTRTLHDCSVVNSPPGSVIVEDHGPGTQHVGTDPWATPVVLWGVYVDPAGASLSDDAPGVVCAPAS